MTNDQLSPTLNGINAILNRIINLETTVAQLRARSGEMEYLISEELIHQISPDQKRLIVEDLGHGWQIERQWMPDPPPAPAQTQPIPAGAADPSDLPDSTDR